MNKQTIVLKIEQWGKGDLGEVKVPTDSINLLEILAGLQKKFSKN